MFTKAERSTFPYLLAHVCAFNMTALNCRAWKFRYLFHDFEKPFLNLFLPYKKVQNIHRKNNKHHPEWLENKIARYYHDTPYDPTYEVNNFLNKFDYDGAIIDWECCHFTKAEEPLDAHEEYNRLLNYDTFKENYPFITKYCYNEFSKRLMNSIKKLGLENK